MLGGQFSEISRILFHKHIRRMAALDYFELRKEAKENLYIVPK